MKCAPPIRWCGSGEILGMKGELAAWLWRVEALDEHPTDIAEPNALEIAGDWLGAARVWQALADPRPSRSPAGTTARRRDRSLSVDLLRLKEIALPAIGLLAAYIGSMIVLLTLPFRMQQQFHFTPAETGAVLAFWPFGFDRDRCASGRRHRHGSNSAADCRRTWTDRRAV